MSQLNVTVAVLQERLDHIEEQNVKREAVQTQMAADIAEIKAKVMRFNGFVAGVLFVFTSIGAILYYVSGPIVQLFKWKHG